MFRGVGHSVGRTDIRRQAPKGPQNENEEGEKDPTALLKETAAARAKIQQ